MYTCTHAFRGAYRFLVAFSLSLCLSLSVLPDHNWYTRVEVVLKPLCPYNVYVPTSDHDLIHRREPSLVSLRARACRCVCVCVWYRYTRTCNGQRYGYCTRSGCQRTWLRVTTCRYIHVIYFKTTREQRVYVYTYYNNIYLYGIQMFV